MQPFLPSTYGRCTGRYSQSSVDDGDACICEGAKAYRRQLTRASGGWR